jgi:hypothetical protein
MNHWHGYCQRHTLRQLSKPVVRQVDERRLGARLAGRKLAEGAVWPRGNQQEQRRAQVGAGQQAQIAPGADGACACQ